MIVRSAEELEELVTFLDERKEKFSNEVLTLIDYFVTDKSGKLTCNTIADVEVVFRYI